MTYDPEKHNRQSIRLKGYDYSQPGFYYVTICTQDRDERFGCAKNGKMNLNKAGEMVDAEWNRIPERYDNVILDTYWIMPNHIHGILQIIYWEQGGSRSNENGSVGTGLVPVFNDQDKWSPNTLTKENIASERRGIKPLPTPLYDMIGTFKSLSQNEYAIHVRNDGWPPFRKRLWQLRFHDHIIRNNDELDRIRNYIEENPKNWYEDENNPRNIMENNDTDS